LHKFIEANVPQNELKELFKTVNNQFLHHKRIACTVPILEDFNGNSALDLALVEG